MGVGGITDGLTNEQYEKLMFLLNNTQLQGNIASTGGSGTRAGGGVVQPVVNQTMAFQATSNDALGKSSHPFSPLWVLDSGATNHIVCHPSYFDSCLPVVNVFVQLPNQLVVPATHKGTLQLSPHLILKDVLCVPSFKFNLVSKGKLNLHITLV
ncbi:hypothetical protein M9H77_10838 [Catharanthus roseus]|uniref:Uncharacterized protein n=1 Tax=Catharanthus roseus TaxID=4058 RepID=A0ACC0BCS8_CATRO|nr:hypothetical protein M9H77_10838 [Catharanthus roseus]